MGKLTPNEERWCDWLESLDPASQLKQDDAGWISRDAFVGGIESEAQRLRPLLDRMEVDFTILARAFGFVEPASLADLRREMGKVR